MTPEVSRQDWQIISEMGTKASSNPLRLGLDGDETPTSVHISDALLDLGDKRDAVMTSLKCAYATMPRYDDGGRDIDLITARLISHMGLEPLTVAWLAAWCDGIYVRDENRNALVDVDVQMKPNETRLCDTQVMIGENATWKACGTMLVDAVPNAIVVATAGRPLASVVSHPVLDAFGLTIARVELAEGDGGAELQTDFAHVFPTVAELAAIRPRGADHA